MRSSGGVNPADSFLVHGDELPELTDEPQYALEELSRSRQDRAGSLGVAGGRRRGGDAFPPPDPSPASPFQPSRAGVRCRHSPSAVASGLVGGKGKAAGRNWPQL